MNVLLKQREAAAQAGFPGRRCMPGMALAVWIIMLGACGTGSRKPAAAGESGDSAAMQQLLHSSPVVPAEQSLARMQVEPGFTVQLAAAEPLVSTPVALVFDEKGRMWVAEMEGYMPDADGTGDDQPAGRIVILEDSDGDGRFDKRSVFMDSLVLPRALCLVENGLLVAEPPRLWFVEIAGDRAGKKVLVDAQYTEGGNVEAQANGLLRGMDNWIYNAGSFKRYRKEGKRWLIERTHQRGQWGITQDDAGRLFYNNNSRNLLGDYFAPGLGAWNSHQRKAAGFNERIVPDDRVYPIRPTTGVNRGYMDGILDSTGRLVNFTAAAGPVLYRGTLFPREYYNNAFVPEPAANLVKRNLLRDSGYRVTGRQAYQQKEFLASTDERFRPVNLYCGADGALYVVDMYRGVIQYRDFLTDYLRDEIKRRGLEKPLNCGRIYRIYPGNRRPQWPAIPASPEQLVTLLDSPEGWLREKAQQLLVDKKMPAAVPLLRRRLQETARPQGLVHALWALEGMHALQPADVLPLMQHADWQIRMQALSVWPVVAGKEAWRQGMPVITQLMQQHDTLGAPYLAWAAHSLPQEEREGLLQRLLQEFPNNAFVADAVISNLEGREAAFLKRLAAAGTDTAAVIYRQLQSTLAYIADNRKSGRNVEKQYPRGVAVYKTTCQPCHGADGNGVRMVAPPLHRSEWVLGNKERLMSIVLGGLTGPVKVNGTLYKVPEVNGDMPGIGSSGMYTNEDIAQLLSYIRNAWSNKADKITAIEVGKMRRQLKGREKAFTVAELQKIY